MSCVVLVPVGQAIPALADLPTKGEVLGTSKIKELPEVKIGEVGNFADCLDFNVDIKFGKFCHLIDPAATVEFSYREPTAIVEMTCLRGKTGFKSLQNAVSSALSASLNQKQNQQCVEPLKTNSGTYHKYYFDTHVWGIHDLTRFQMNAGFWDVVESLVCKHGQAFISLAKNLSSITAALKDVSSLGDAVTKVTDSVKQKFNDFVQKVKDLPASTIQKVKDSVGRIANLGEELQNMADNVVSSVQDKVSALTSKLESLNEMASKFNPEELLAKANDAVGDIANTVQEKFADFGDKIGDLQSQLADLASTTDLAGLDAGGFLETLAPLTAMAEPMSALRTVTGVDITNVTDLLLSPAKLTNMGLQVDEIAGAVEEKAAAWEALNQTIMVADATGKVTSTRNEMADLAAALRDVAKELRAAAYDDEYAAFLAQVNIMKSNLGLGERLGDLVRLARSNTRGLYADGFLRTGGSEQAAVQGEEIFESLKSNVLGAGEQATKLASSVADGDVDVCTGLETLKAKQETMSELKITVSDAGYDLGLYPKATYLPQGYIQYIENGKPSPSCPLTTAGYKAVPQVGGVSKVMVNCHEECVPKDLSNPDKGCDMQWVPDIGKYLPDGATCETNRLSYLQPDTEVKYPACNGYFMETRRVRDSDGDYRIEETGRYKYSDALDHRKYLYKKRTRQFVTAVNTALRAVNRATASVAKAAGTSCTTSISPTAVIKSVPNNTLAENDPVMSMVPDFKEKAMNQLGLSHQFKAAKEVDDAVAALHKEYISRFADKKGVDVNNLKGSASLDNLVDTAQLEKALDLLNKGAVRTYVSALAGQKLPYGLWLGFASESTDWMEPRSGIKSTLTNMLAPIVTAPLWMVCSGSSMLRSLVGSELTDAIATEQDIESLLQCIGSWGTSTEHGWAYNKVKPLAGALVGARGYRVAVRIGGIQDDVSPHTRQFNHDFPRLYNYTSEYSKKTTMGDHVNSHLGSKCYDEGTTDSSWYMAGEKGGSFAGLAVPDVDPTGLITAPAKIVGVAPDTEAEMDKGYYVQTRWKHTKCEMRFGLFDTAAKISGMDAGQFASKLAQGKISPCKFKQIY